VNAPRLAYRLVCLILITGVFFSFSYSCHLRSALENLQEKIKNLEAKKENELQKRLDKMIERMENEKERSR